MTARIVLCGCLWVASALFELGLAAPVPGPECSHIFGETGVPELDGDTADATAGSAGHTFICREGYGLFHNNTTKIPDWVAEDVTVDEITGNAERADNFEEDPLVPPPTGASLKDYKSSGFDRGHQAPAADFKSDQTLMDESFFLSNMAPQVGQCFNRGIWAKLEDDVREWARSRKRLIVFTGPIYPDPIQTIGDKVPAKVGVQVGVPEAFYKIVYHPKSGHAVAFLMPNERLCSREPSEFVVSIDEIEELTGIDFFNALTHRKQNSLEKDRGNVWGW